MKTLTPAEKGVITRAANIMENYLKYNDIKLCSPKETRAYIQARFIDLEHEQFSVVYMDNRNRVIEFKDHFTGTIDGASVYPREIVKEALKQNSAAVIFVHNHPSGVAEPSNADEAITKRLKEALSLIDVRVLDHFICGVELVSMAERGLI